MISALRRSAALASSIFALLTVQADLFAQKPLTPPVPLGNDAPRGAGESLLTQGAAQRSLEMGFFTLAAQLFQQLATAPNVSPAVRNDLVVQWATALMNDNRLAEAEQALKQYVGLPSASYRLRGALLAARLKRFDFARTEVNSIPFEELPEPDRGWYYFLKGLLSYQSDNQRDYQKAGGFFQQAIDASTSNLQRTRFILAQLETKLEIATNDDVSLMRQIIERSGGKAQAYSTIRDLSIVLAARGDRAGAISLLQNQLLSLPREQRQVHDEWSLLLGLIAGPTEGVGRNALRNLLTSGSDREKQRVALQILAENSQEGTRREEFRAKLDELISAPQPHPLLEELLLFRAKLALGSRQDGQGNLTRAEDDANQLLQRFPGSQLKGLALGILTNAAWERGQYRNAASLASKARDQVGAGQVRAQLGVLVAEAYFRGNDYQAAADAYGAALSDMPAGVHAGDLMFQQILAEIMSQQLDAAAKLLDDRSRDPRFDPMNRWQAEWNLTRALQASGKTAEAYGRLNQLLNDVSASAAIPKELHARMRWLQARLSYDIGEYQKTLQLTESLLGDVAGLEEPLRADIASTTILLQVQARYSLAEPTPTELLRRLRADYPSTDAAVYSYIVEADAAARKGSLVEAQRLLRSLAEEFPKSEYAPYGLYQAARYAEQRGQPVQYREANELLESLVNKYGDSELVFYARLQQGHLMRRLAEFGRAQQAYLSLDNDPKFAQHPARAAVQLALADTYASQAASNPGHLEEAHRIYERLLDLPTASIDLRVEAGHKLGLSLSRHNRPESAMRVWGLVIGLLTQSDKKPVTFSAQGRYWMARTLLRFGDLLRAQGRIEQAREAYELVLRTQLPGVNAAQDALNSLSPGRPTP